MGTHAASGPGLGSLPGARGEEATLQPGLAAWSPRPARDLREGSLPKPDLALCYQVSHGIKGLGCIGNFTGNFSFFPYFLPARGKVEQLLTPKRFQARVLRARGSGFCVCGAGVIPPHLHPYLRLPSGEGGTVLSDPLLQAKVVSVTVDFLDFVFAF